MLIEVRGVPFTSFFDQPISITVLNRINNLVSLRLVVFACCPMHYTSNPDLPQHPLPFPWKGTPVTDKGRFVNHEFPFVASYRDLLKWKSSRNPQKDEKKNDTWKLEVVFDQAFLKEKSDCLVWLGHASFFIRLSGISLLIDPVLFDNAFLKRLVPLPVSPEQFTGLDYLLISHDHRDHCDKKSLKTLAANNPNVTWLTGLHLDVLLKQITGSQNLQAAGWYQTFRTNEPLRITYVPSRHWGKRSLRDTNLRLWGGFVIESQGKTIYFCGDSGYGSHFADIGKLFPSIDYCLVGIGAYKPEYFMKQNHTSPADAVRAFRDTGARNMIPMHYGTYDLSDEPPGDPIRVLKRLQAHGKIGGPFTELKVGETLLL
jgi:L-ascorbate metabolism protein UlaG (beta-lactamase superfamily)